MAGSSESLSRSTDIQNSLLVVCTIKGMDDVPLATEDTPVAEEGRTRVVTWNDYSSILVLLLDRRVELTSEVVSSMGSK